MKTKKIELGDVFYVFTNWGLCRGRVVKKESVLLNKENVAKGDEIPTDEDGVEIDEWGVDQYKLNIDYNEENKNLKYGFWYTETQLFETPYDALKDQCDFWGIKI
jgi:hypothetical protein